MNAHQRRTKRRRERCKLLAAVEFFDNFSRSIDKMVREVVRAFTELSRAMSVKIDAVLTVPPSILRTASSIP